MSSDSSMAPEPYEALPPGGDTPSIWSLSRLLRMGLARLPGARTRFARALGIALGEAASRGDGFYLNVSDARAALGDALMIEVDPAHLTMRVQEHVLENGKPVSIADRFLGAGDWSPLIAPARKSPTVWEIEQIVAKDLDFRKTICFERYVARASAGNPVKRNHLVLDTRQRIEAYLGHSVDMLRSVKANGVVSRRDWVHRGSRPGGRGRLIEASEQEVGVAVGVSGELYRFCAGKHRTAAAVALKLNSMPAEVRLVHARWLAGVVKETGLPPVAALVEGIRRLGEARSEAGPG